MSDRDSVPHDLEQLKKQAKTLLKTVNTGDRKALGRFAALGLSHRVSNGYKLTDAQFVIGREKGFESWRKLRSYIEESIDQVFFAAIEEGKVRKVKLLLREYPRLKTQRNRTTRLLPIQVAMQKGQQELVRMLLDLAKPRALNTAKFLPFQKGKGHEIWEMINAAYTGNLDKIKALVKKSPNLVNCEYDYQSPLHLAVINGHDKVAEYLVEQGADIACRNYLYKDSLVRTATDRQDSHLREVFVKALKKRFPHYAPGSHEILKAALENDLKSIKSCLEASPNHINICSENGDTPLHIASRNLNFELVRMLVGKRADLNAVNKDGFKPIHAAIYRNNFWNEREEGWPIAEFLKENGTDYTINLAATFGDLGSVETFLRKDASSSNFSDTCQKRPLSSAASRGDDKMVELLLRHGANPSLAEANAPKGYALYVAADRGYEKVVKLLLEAGADPHSPVHASGTAFSTARKHPAIYSLFKEYSTELSKPDPEQKDGLDPVADAIIRNELEKVRQYLDENPEIVTNESAFYGEGYLAIAANRRHHEIIDLLLERGAKTPDESCWGSGYSFRHLDIARKLLQEGASPNHCNWLKRTVLHEFAYRGDVDKVELLLEFGAEVDLVDMEYRSTPLGFAARGGQAEVVELLLEAGANPDWPTEPAWAKPLAWAKARSHAKVEQILKRALAVD